jgi:hypothetical protein
VVRQRPLPFMLPTSDPCGPAWTSSSPMEGRAGALRLGQVHRGAATDRQTVRRGAATGTLCKRPVQRNAGSGRFPPAHLPLTISPCCPCANVQATFVYKGYEEVRRLGLREETEAAVRSAIEAEARSGAWAPLESSATLRV